MSLNENDGTKKIIDPYPKSLLVFIELLLVSPFIASWGYFTFIRAISISDMVQAAFSPVSIISVLVFMLLGFLIYKTMTAKIREYDGTEESCTITNNRIQTFIMAVYALGIFHGFWLIFLIYISCKMKGISVPVLSLFITCIGCTFIFALFFAVFFTQSLEVHSYQLPFRKEHKSMSLIKRSALVNFFSTIGLACCAVAPALVPLNHGLELSTLFVKYIFPAGLVGCVISVSDNLMQIQAIIARLKEISTFVSLIAKNDYSGENLEVRSHDEFGYLVDDINDFYALTKRLLAKIRDSVSISTGSAEDLADRKSVV